MFRMIAICSFGMMLVGCERGPTPIKWTQNELTPAQQVRQDDLLVEIAPQLKGSSESLDGSRAVEHEELLALSDRIGKRGSEAFYTFNVLTDGDVHVPGELIIVVTEETIKTARWPYGGEN